MSDEQLQAFYEHGYRLMVQYREQERTAIDTNEWFKARMDPESFEDWLTWDMKRTVTSDKYYNSKSSPEQKQFRRLMNWRMAHGWWVESPRFSRLSAAAQAELRSQYPMAGYVYRMPGPLFLGYNFCRVMNASSDLQQGGAIHFKPNRRDNFIHDVFEVMARHKLERGERRQALYKPKARGCHFTTAMYLRALRGIQLVPMYRHLIMQDLDTKIAENIREFENLYNSQPRYMRPYKYSADGKNKIVEMYDARATGSKGSFKLRFQDPQGGEFVNQLVISTHDPIRVEGARYMEIDIDESGISRYDLIRTRQRSEGLMIAGSGRAEGLIVIGGTSDAQNGINMDFLAGLALKPADNDVFCCFTPAHFFSEPDAAGHVPVENNKADLLDRRAKILADGTPLSQRIYLEEITRYPLELQDCLHVTTESDLDIVALERRREHLRAQALRGVPDFQIQQGRFEAQRGDIGQPIWVPDPQGPWRIWRHPDNRVVVRSTGASRDIIGLRPNGLYFASTDDVMHDITPKEAERMRGGSSRKSYNAMVVFDAEEQRAIAVFQNRSADRTEDFRQMMMGFLYYRCYVFPERNTNQFVDYVLNYQDNLYGRHTFLDFLYPTPLPQGNWNKSTSRLQTKRGYDTKRNKVDIYQTLVPAHFAAAIDKVMFPEIVDQFAKWRPEIKAYNPDLANAYLVGLVGLQDFRSRFLRSHHNQYEHYGKQIQQAQSLKILRRRGDLSEYGW